jgi:hypothetical protein
MQDAVRIMALDDGMAEGQVLTELKRIADSLQPVPVGLSLPEAAAWIAARDGGTADDVLAAMLATAHRARGLR